MRHGDNDDGQGHCREADQGVVVPREGDREDGDGARRARGMTRPVEDLFMSVRCGYDASEAD